MRGTKVKALNRIFRREPPVPGSTSKQRLVMGEKVSPRGFRWRITRDGSPAPEPPRPRRTMAEKTAAALAAGRRDRAKRAEDAAAEKRLLGAGILMPRKPREVFPCGLSRGSVLHRLRWVTRPGKRPFPGAACEPGVRLSPRGTSWTAATSLRRCPACAEEGS